jgi:hypothetical protein
MPQLSGQLGTLLSAKSSTLKMALRLNRLLCSEFKITSPVSILLGF